MKRFSLVLLIVILICSLAVTAGASTIFDASSGKVIYTDDEWAYERVNPGSYEINSYIGEGSVASVPYSYMKEYVTSIGENAFSLKDGLTSVTTTERIHSIGAYAFYGCTSLKEVVLFSTLTSIDVCCFYGDVSLKNVNIQDTSIEVVSGYCFADCGLEEIILPDSCAKIGPYAFMQCSSLNHVTIPESVTEISDTAFFGCENLVIYAPYGSYAIDYAVAHEIPYAYSDLTEVTYIRGDADGDGAITIMDATKIQRVLAYYEDDTDGMIALRASLDGENLGIMDATRIQRKLALYDDPYGIGESVTVFLRPDGEIVSLNAEQA